MTGIPHPGGVPGPGARNPGSGSRNPGPGSRNSGSGSRNSGAQDAAAPYGDPPPGAARTGPPPQRVAVTGPRRHRAGGYSVRPGAADLHAQPRLGQIYVRSLVRDQLRLSLGVLAVLTVVIGGLPAAFALVPALRTAELGGIRLAWLLLGVVAYPVLVGAAWFHVRHAERGERDFTELLSADPLSAYEPPPTDAPGPAAQPAGTPRTGTPGSETATGAGGMGPDTATGTDGPGPGTDGPGPGTDGPGPGTDTNPRSGPGTGASPDAPGARDR